MSPMQDSAGRSQSRGASRCKDPQKPPPPPPPPEPNRGNPSAARVRQTPGSSELLRADLIKSATALHSLSDSDAEDGDQPEAETIEAAAAKPNAAAAKKAPHEPPADAERGAGICTDAEKPPKKGARKDKRMLAEMRARIPQLFDVLEVHGRIGEGTFSSVFLATLCSEQHVEYLQRKFFAIKYLVPTSHPARVERELKCLIEIGGRDNVAGVELCLRREECVAFVMPYLEHNRFQDYFDRLSAAQLQHYMRNLLIALARVHSFGIIHRDIKPSNFLHERKTQTYMLVDFGLAQPIKGAESTAPDARVSSTSAVAAGATTAATPAAPAPATTAAAAKRKATDWTENCAKRAKPNAPAPSSCSAQQQQQHNQLMSRTRPTAAGAGAVASSATQQPSPFKSPLKQSNGNGTPRAAPKKSLAAPASPLANNVSAAIVNYGLVYRLAPNRQQSSARLAAAEANLAVFATKQQQQQRQQKPPPPPKSSAAASSLSSASPVACYCYGRPTICNLCIIKREVHASRAGTPGYRPPEVLLKQTHQTTAVDIWAAGVIMLSCLSASYPFFRGGDDYTALAEMCTIFGDEAIKKAALAMSRHVCYSQKRRPLHLRKLCLRLRARSNSAASASVGGSRRAAEKAALAAAATAAVAAAAATANTNTTTKVTLATCSNCAQALTECLCQHSPLNTDWTDDRYPASAYDLLARLLCVNPAARITAAEALRHPFLLAELAE